MKSLHSPRLLAPFTTNSISFGVRSRPTNFTQYSLCSCDNLWFLVSTLRPWPGMPKTLLKSRDLKECHTMLLVKNVFVLLFLLYISIIVLKIDSNNRMENIGNHIAQCTCARIRICLIKSVSAISCHHFWHSLPFNPSNWTVRCDRSAFTFYFLLLDVVDPATRTPKANTHILFHICLQLIFPLLSFPCGLHNNGLLFCLLV